MRVLIISDMEGVAGITKLAQVTGGEKLYDEGRRLYTEEINAAVRGAVSAGATEVAVMDHHGAGEDAWMFNSLLPELLDPACDWIVQNRWTEYTEMLERGCDAAILIGMHAMMGTSDGVLCHTVSGVDWHSLRFNDVEVGEIGANAAFCGHWRCPVVMVTGDEAACREARALLGDALTTVAVKRGFGRFAARHISPLRVRPMIEEGAERALKARASIAPYVPGPPVEITVRFHRAGPAELHAVRPGIELLDSRTIVSRADDWLTAWRRLDT